MVSAQAPPESIARVMAKLRKPSGVPHAFGILIYGKTGCGKTSLLGTMPGDGFVVYTNRKEGRGGDNVLAPWADRIDVYPLSTWAELDDVVVYLESVPKKYRWVALDSVTGLLSLAEEATVGRIKSLNASPRSLKGDEWGRMGGRIIRMLEALNEMDLITIVTAQEKVREIPELGTKVAPNVTPMILEPLTAPQYLNIYLRQADLGNGILERQARVQEHPTYYTKNRLPRPLADQLPEIIRNPNLEEIIGFMWGKNPPPQGATQPTASVAESSDFDDEF